MVSVYKVISIRPRKKRAEQKIIALIGLSQRRCMKNNATSEPLIEAISIAMITLTMPSPKSMRDAATVTTVRNKSAPRTNA
jgi:hypothetical protein